jgi:hypothetical protein
MAATFDEERFARTIEMRSEERRKETSWEREKVARWPFLAFRSASGTIN